VSAQRIFAHHVRRPGVLELTMIRRAKWWSRIETGTDGPSHISLEAMEVLAVAEAPNFVSFDGLTSRRFELHHVVAVTEEDASNSDGHHSIRRRRTKLFTAALVMHMPAHRPNWRGATEIALIGSMSVTSVFLSPSNQPARFVLA
jgi:hypothetical protein